jgi:hypothetical protein
MRSFHGECECAFIHATEISIGNLLSASLKPFPHLTNTDETILCTCRGGESMSLNCGHKLAYCSSLGYILVWAWRAAVEWYWQEKTEWLRKKPVPVPLCPTQVPHWLTRARIRCSTVKGRLTAWAISWQKQWNLSMLVTYGATKNRRTYTGGQFIENHIFDMTTYIYIHSYNNYSNIIIILHTSTDHLWFTMSYVLFVKSNF